MKPRRLTTSLLLILPHMSILIPRGSDALAFDPFLRLAQRLREAWYRPDRERVEQLERLIAELAADLGYHVTRRKSDFPPWPGVPGGRADQLNAPATGDRGGTRGHARDDTK